MDSFDPDASLPTLYGIWERYADSARPGERRIAEVAKEMIEELEGQEPPDREL